MQAVVYHGAVPPRDGDAVPTSPGDVVASSAPVRSTATARIR